MKTKIWKQVGAIVLALALVLTALPQSCFEALAEDATTVTNEFKVTGLNANTTVYNGGTHWRIALNYEGTFDIGGTWGKDLYYGWLNHNIDDAPGGGNIQCYQSSTSTENSFFTLQFSKSVIPTDGTANCKLTLKGGTWSKTGSSGKVYNSTMAEDVDIYFNKYGVSVGSPIQGPAETGVYIKEVANASYNTRNYVQFLLSEDIGYEAGSVLTTREGFVNGAYYYTDSNAGIWVGEQWYHGASATAATSIEFMKPTSDKWQEGVWRLHPQWYNNNGAIADGLRLTVQGLFYAGDHTVEIDKSVMQWCVTEAGATSSKSGYWVLLPRLLELAEGTTVDNGQWKIHMSHTGQLVGETGETFTGKAMIGDEEIDVQIYADGSNIVIAPPADKVPADGSSVTMTLKAGDITGSAGSTSMIVNDVTFCFNKYGMALNNPIEAPDTTGIYIKRVQQYTNGYLWFAMSKGDTVEKSNAMATISDGLHDGKFYYNQNSGIWVNGEIELDTTDPGDIQFFKIPENFNPPTDTYYRVHQQWYKIVDGSRIKIQGIFEAADGKSIQVDTSIMECDLAENGTQKWILLPRLLELAGTPEVVGGKWKIPMTYVGTLAGAEGEVFTATAYVGETPYAVSIYQEGENLVIIPTAEAFPTDGTETVMVLKAGDITGDQGGKSMIVNDVTICVNKYGVSLNEPIPSYTIVENKLEPNTTCEDDTWNIFMKQSGSFLSKADEKFEWPVTINGTETTVDVYATKVDGTVYFNPVIPDTEALKPSSGNVKVVIKKGFVTGSQGTENELKEDVTLYFDKYGLSTTGSTGDFDELTSGVKLGLTTPLNWPASLYFKSSKADGIVGDSSWAVKPVSLSGYRDGVCYRGDGGLYITSPDGVTTKFAPNSKTVPSLIKIGNYGTSSSVYYIGLGDANKPEAGTRVEFKGVYEWNGALVGIDSTVLEWNGSQWFNVTPAHDKNVEFTLHENSGTSKIIYLKGTDGFDPSASAFIDPMPGEENGVFLNGIRTNVQLYKIGSPNNESVYHVLLTGQDIEAQVGDEIVIKGRFISNCYIVEYKEVMFTFDGSKWVTSNLPTKVTPSDTTEGDSATSVGFTVSPQDALQVDAINAYTFTEGGIYVNGLYNAAAQLYKLGANLYKVDLSTSGMTFEKGNTVTVDGTVEKSGVKVEYLRSVFTYEGNGVWTLTESGIPKEPVRFELDAENSYKAANGDWKLLFKATDGLRGDPGVVADATYRGLMAIINNSTEYAPSFFKNSKSYYEVTIPNGSLPSTNGVYEIVIKRGTITGGWEDAAGRYMQKEIVLYVNGDRISDKGTPTESKDVTLTYASGTKSELNLLLNGEDAMIVTTKNGGTIYAENEPNSGVFVNGVKKENLGIFKFEDGSSKYYYVPFSGINYTPANGDVVVVNGTFKLANYFVTFNTVAMRWNGSSWSAISDLSSITLNDTTCDASDTAFIIDAEGTAVNGNIVESGKVLYKEGTYNLVYSIGSAKMTQTLKITYEFTSAGNNGAGKADTTLPDMVTGEANAAGQFITDVKATTHGTTVISMDKDNTYKTTADFDDYGLDYVLDINIDDDREFKVLQFADTQTIDSEQIRPNRGLGVVLAAQSVPEKQYENWQYYVENVVAKSKPDVILIAGDVLYSEFDDKGTSILDLIAFMDSLQIPWAPVFGNHDNESSKGVDWQCEQYMNSTYCLFNQRHEGVGGNGNYSIGLARNGQLEKAIYMLDSNGCGNVAKSGNTYSTWGYDGNGNMTQIRAASGFYQTQIDWYGTTAKRVNAVAGKVIPSIQCYHIGTEEVLLAARAAGYQYGEENASAKYGMKNDPELDSYFTPCHDLFTNQDYYIDYSVRPQTGDSGYKMGQFSDLHRANGMLELMNEVGTTGVFLGHNHSINTSMTYGGVRWTYGLKTGMFANDTVNKGGTLIKMDLDESGFEVEQIHVELEYSEPTLDGDKVSENTASVIYINGNAIRDAIPNNTLKAANDAECGIFVNTVKVDASIEKYAADKYKVILPNAVKVGDVITVYGIFENETASHAVYFRKTLAIKWDGTMWNAISVDTINGSTVNVNSVGVDYEQLKTYNLPDGTLPLQIAADGTKTSVESVTGYGDNMVQSKLDNILYKQIIALYIPGDSHTDEAIDVLDLVAMMKAENGEAATSETEKYADQLGAQGLREKLVGK